MENEKRIATSNAEMVTISRAEYESQQTQLTELKLQNQWLLEQLGLAKKRQFGSSSEKLQEGLMDQLSLSFNELEAYAYGTKSATPEQVAVKAHARKKQSGSVTEIVPEGTPTEVVEHRLSEEELICSACGSKMEEIGKEVRRSLQMEPARFWIREDVYYTYACRKCEQDSGEANILKTPKEPALLPGSYASAEAVAHIAVQKFVMYSPLYRLEQEGELELIAALLSGDEKTFKLFRTQAPELLHLPDATYEWYCKHYLDRYYPVRFILHHQGIEFPRA